MLVLLVCLETRRPRGERDAYIGIPEPRDGGDLDCGAVLEPGASALLELGRRRRKLHLLHASREQHPPVVGDDVDPCPSRIEQLSDAAGEAVQLIVEELDQPHPDVVAAVVDLAGLGPRSPARVFLYR